MSYVICEQQRRRSACASAQSDQRLCFSLFRWSNISRFYSRNLNTLASFCGCAGRFVFGLVGNSLRHVLSCRGSYVDRYVGTSVIAETVTNEIARKYRKTIFFNRLQSNMVDTLSIRPDLIVKQQLVETLIASEFRWACWTGFCLSIKGSLADAITKPVLLFFRRMNHCGPLWWSQECGRHQRVQIQTKDD